MREVILATLELGSDQLEIYPEVVAALKGELHEGMVMGNIIVNPAAKELQKIRAKVPVNGKIILSLVVYLGDRIEQVNGRVTYYSNVP